MATKPNQPAPATPLEQLHADRARVTGELTTLNVAAAKLRAAANAEAAVHREIADMGSATVQIMELNERLGGLVLLIEAAALDAMQAEFAGIFDQHRIAVESTRALTAKIAGLASYLSNLGREQIELRGNTLAGRQYLTRAEALSTLRLTDPGLTRGEIIDGVTFWARRAAALRKGPAS